MFENGEQHDNATNRDRREERLRPQGALLFDNCRAQRKPKQKEQKKHRSE